MLSNTGLLLLPYAIFPWSHNYPSERDKSEYGKQSQIMEKGWFPGLAPQLTEADILACFPLQGGPYLHCPVTNSLSNDELAQGGHPVGPSPVNNELPVSHVSWLQPTVFTASVPSIIITLSLDATSNPIYSVGFSPSLATSLVRIKHYQNEQILQFWWAQTQGSTKGQINKKPRHFFFLKKTKW